MVDYDDLYDKLLKMMFNGASNFINRNYIINKTKSKEQYYNSKLNTNPLPYFSTVMKHTIMVELKKNQVKITRINNRIKKLKKLGI
jgi:hypothetical protein